MVAKLSSGCTSSTARPPSRRKASTSSTLARSPNAWREKPCPVRARFSATAAS